MAYRANAPPPLDLGLSAAAEDPLPRPGTPCKLVCHGLTRWAHQLIENAELRKLQVSEMTGNFIGPMPPREFLKEFMQMDDFEPAPKVDFTSVPYEGLERGMYQELCDAINDSGVCPGYTLADVSNRVDENGIEIRPDWALCRGTRIKDKLDFSNMEFPGEGKASKIADAFFDTEESDKTLNPLEKVTGQSASTRGQLISYTATLHSFQHRCFSFSFLICGQYARLFRWDRSGCVVTALFNFHDEPELLAAFFWCYAHLSLEEQGYDTTVKRATLEETKYLADAVDNFIVDSLPRDVSFMLPEENPAHPYPVCKIRVEMKDGPHNLIVKMPFLDSSDSACGRATRAYTAFDMKERRLVFFKDSWRTEDEDYASEAEIYEELIKCGVPFLPIVLAAGDVTSKGSGEPQITFTQVWSDNVDKPEWRLPCDRLRKLIHHRVVQELAYPLNTARCSKEATQAVRDVVEALKVSYHVAEYNHRDVSTGNVMIDENGRGVLNDWDHAVKVVRHGKGHAYRTGTWQFISVALLRHPKKSHDLLDDLESSFWLLLYVSYIHFELDEGSLEPDFGIFNEYTETKFADGNYYALGGNGKTSLLSNGELSRYEWKSAPLNHLLQSLSRILAKLNSLRRKVRDKQPKAPEKLKALEDRLRTVDPFLQLFDEALAMDSWVDDRRANPVDKTNKKQAEQKRLEAKTASYRTIQEQASAAQLTKPKTLPAGPSHLSSVLASGSSHSSTKRRADEVSENVQVEEKRKFVKRARTEMPPREDSEQPPQAVGEHRYQTRSKTKSKTKSNGSRNSKSAPKKSLQDVSMQDVNHNYGLRSRTKAKANPPPPPPPPKARARRPKKAAKQPAPKQSEKQAQPNKKHDRQNKRPPWR
ncbi:hypothetical protein QCA50_014173 [Cerrena zonata]|uniref:Fungal-type protein kinase domain-containing protein n=1 Tax=Cerrena zonata TaxID=2478898 RepID=A0AAW0FUQ4_9APHY